MLAWAVERALRTDLFDRIIVSTDSEEVAQIATKLGAEVPFLRPTDLSGDHVGTYEVVKHAINWLQQTEYIPHYVCCTYPTTPFLKSEDLIQGYNAIKFGDSLMAFGATSFSYPIQRAFYLSEKFAPVMFEPAAFNSRSQDLEEAYHDAGQFLWGTSSAWINDTHPFGCNSHAVIIPRHRIQDIDTPEDWTRAELLMKAMKTANEVGSEAFK